MSSQNDPAPDTLKARFRRLVVRCAHRWLPRWVAWVLASVAGILLILVGIAQVADYTPAILNPDTGRLSYTGFLVAALLFAGFSFVATIPNFLHEWVSNHARSRLRTGQTFFASHDLSKAVGQCLRLILLDASDPQPADAYPPITNPLATDWLRTHADDAPSKWATLVAAEAIKPDSPYAALREANLWRYVEHRDAPTLPDSAWLLVLRWINNGHTLPFEHEPPATSAIIARLNARFGEALWEYTKNDFVNDGAQAEAFHLLIASQLLQRTASLAEGMDNLQDALADLTAEWRKHQADVEAQVKKLVRSQALATKLLSANTRTLTQIAVKLDARHAPRFQVFTKDTGESGRFVFRNERLTLVGREDVLDDLANWLKDDRPFGWELCTGPAGAGKSRLALELLSRNKNWAGGFYDYTASTNVDWESWSPRRNTLIVFDYVAERPKVVVDALRLLSQRTAPASRNALPKGIKVRALLLEREVSRGADPVPGAGAVASAAEPQWMGLLRQAMKLTGTLLSECHWRSAAPHPERHLCEINEDAISRLVLEEHRLADETSQTKHIPPSADVLEGRLKLIKRLDPRCRPLFIAMAAEAIRESGGSLNSTGTLPDMQTVVGYIRQKEWDHWQKRLAAIGMDSSNDLAIWGRMVCVATMCGGLDEPALTKALKKNGEVGLPKKADWQNGDTYNILVSGAGPKHAPKLEPDALGEAFVLWRLEQDAMMANDLVELSWSLGIRPFLNRVAESYPLHEEVDRLLKLPTGADSAEAREFVAGVRSSLARRLLLRGETSQASRHIDEAIRLQGGEA